MADKPAIDGATLDRLFAVIASRVGADPSLSYTAQLLRAGTAQIVKKFGEEAVETVIEAMKGDRARLAAESADLLYHLLRSGRRSRSARRAPASPKSNRGFPEAGGGFGEHLRPQ